MARGAEALKGGNFCGIGEDVGGIGEDGGRALRDEEGSKGSRWEEGKSTGRRRRRWGCRGLLGIAANPAHGFIDVQPGFGVLFGVVTERDKIGLKYLMGRVITRKIDGYETHLIYVNFQTFRASSRNNPGDREGRGTASSSWGCRRGHWAISKLGGILVVGRRAQGEVGGTEQCILAIAE